MDRERIINYVINGILLFASLAILGISIAVLVKVYNEEDHKDQPPSPKQQTNHLNVRPPKQIGPGDSKYSGYQTATELFKAHLNTTIDPCKDFYQYTCGNFKDRTSFAVSTIDSAKAMTEQMMNPEYVNHAPGPVKQVAWYYKQCVQARMEWNELTKNGKVVMDAVNRLAAGKEGFEERTRFPFYMLYQNENVKSFPDTKGLGYLIGHPAGFEGANSLVTLSPDTNWKDPHGKDGYIYMIDQPTTIFHHSIHTAVWTLFRDQLEEKVYGIVTALAATQNLKLDKEMLKKDAKDIIDFDHLLALKYSTDSNTRRTFERNYNPFTFAQLKLAYPKFCWHTLLGEATGPAKHVLKRVFDDPEYKFVVMEPEKLKMLHDALGDPSFVSNRTLVNYIYFKMVYLLANFLPSSSAKERVRFHNDQPTVGRPRHIRREEEYEQRQYKDLSQAQFSCAMETAYHMPYANARVFIDKMYPSEEIRMKMRDDVTTIVSNVIVAFHTMIDQLNWMTSATKERVYAKIDNLVKNIAYPDFITSDEQLTGYYERLDIKVNVDDYFTMERQTRLFYTNISWDSLLSGPVQRTDFNGPPGIVNAWYQPNYNSITFPAGILRQPFYDPSWPTSVKYGAVGVIAGHELTHGFDDMGVQWDGTGILRGWMDDSSKAGFEKMASCVIKEYDQFCPLNRTIYGKAACVNGAMTQGENIADNGGIQAAFRAYRNFINLYGPDPQLPDELLQEFTADQLFFLSFSRIWCEPPVPDGKMMINLLTDVHSPRQYRVWGTIQNFPAFKDAFHCPSSIYAPDEHCDVWISEIEASRGEPVVKTELNILPHEQITTSDIEQYDAYKLATKFFEDSVNTSANPCDDFFQYACGKYQKPVSFRLARARNHQLMVKQLYDPDYQDTIESSTALKKEKILVDACVEATLNPKKTQEILASRNYVMPRVNKLAGYLGSNFTYSFGGTVAALPNSKQLANALGYLSFDQGIDTLVTPMVDTNWPEPKKGYKMFLDQNTAYLSKTYYGPNAFKTIKESYVNSATNVIEIFTKAQGVATDPNLRENVRGLVEFEQTIANTYSTDDDTRRAYQRSWNLMTMDDLETNYTWVDWHQYMTLVPKVAQEVIGKKDYTFSVYEPDQYKKVNSDYKNWEKTKLVNYLFMRLLLSNAQYLPSYSKALKKMPEEPIVLGRRRPYFRFTKTSNIEETKANCVGMANYLMMYANGRVFNDYLYRDEDSKKMIRETAGGIIENVIHAFQGMLDELDWMSTQTKRKAYEKTMGIIQNIAFPDWIMNNTKLDMYYKDIVFNKLHENYYDMWTKLIIFNKAVEYKLLTAASTDRHDFYAQPGTVNAWYIPELNSITFPAGILRPPYFLSQWPASINYGGIGVVAGHELTHGFDDQGVQWGPTGEISTPANNDSLGWMDEFSTHGFNAMAQCVIDEYSKFCPLDSKTYTPNCVNGAQTQGENIADNGGIHSAFRAYRTHIALNGPDPLLPDRLFGQFTHDQLFFLSFAQVWCEKRRTDEKLYQQLMVDPHSPAMYRVFGTFQNYPAFRVAFNCPADTPYTPTKHCNVWVPNYVP